jgi:hypothetical protein
MAILARFERLQLIVQEGVETFQRGSRSNLAALARKPTHRWAEGVGPRTEVPTHSAKVMAPDNQLPRCSGIAQRAASLGIVPVAACPVTRQCTDGPEHRHKKKQPAPRNFVAPCPQRSQARNDRGRSYSGRPHDSLGPRAGVLHRTFFCLHSEEREMFKDPAQARRPSFRIAGSPNRVIGKTNTEEPPGKPVGDAMTAEIQKYPSTKHHSHGEPRCSCRLRFNQAETGHRKSGNLKRISDGNRKTKKNFAQRRIHIYLNTIPSPPAAASSTCGAPTAIARDTCARSPR